jgi:hypothetical protein
MSFPVQVIFRGLNPSEALSRLVQKEAAKLDKFFDGIVSCRVLVERPSAHHQNGSPYHVHVNVIVPGADLAIVTEPRDEIDAIYRDPALAVRDTFRRAKRRVQDYARRKIGSHSRSSIRSE